MKISTPKFLLKKPKADKETPISLYVRFNNERVVYSTGEQIHPSNWDFKTQRVKGSRKKFDVADINDWLDKIENTAKCIFRALKYDGITPTPALIRQELSRVLNDKPSKAKMTFFNTSKNILKKQKQLKTMAQ